MRHILVYGGSGYVGRALVQELVKDPDTHVTWTYHRHALLLPNSNQSARHCDITSRESLQTLHQSLAPLDGVAFAAAYPVSTLFSKSDEAINYKRSWDSSGDDEALIRFYSIHLLDAIRPCIPLLKASVNPNMVFVGSLMGVKGVPSPLSLALAKSSLRGVVESLAKDLGEFNIKVNSVNPGILDGGQADELSKKLKTDYLKHTSLKRFGTGEDMAKVMAWLLLRNTFVTSQAIVLDGGL